MIRQRLLIELVSKKDEFAKDMLQRDDGIIVTIGDENNDSSMKIARL